MKNVRTFTADYDSLYSYLSDDIMEKIHLPCDTLLKVLSDSFDDECDWIGYWVYELDFGETYVDGMVTIDDVVVKMETVEDLYTVLTENKGK
jgi:hypothetical protein